MTRRWNGKALIDEVARRVWDDSSGTSGFRQELIAYANEIQDELASIIPQKFFKHKLKKLLPVSQENIILSPETPTAPTVGFVETTTTLTYNTANSGNFVANSNIEYTSTLAGLAKNISDANETFYANYTNDINGWRGDGTLTGTAANNAAVSGGKLVLTSGSADEVVYDADGNADSQQTITIRMKVTPAWSGDPGANIAFFMIQKAAADTINQIKLEYLTGSGFRVFVKDQANSIQLNYIPGTWSPTSGTEYEIQVCLDLTTGANRLFIDGAQLGTTNTDTATRDANIAHFSIGDSDIGALPNFSVDDVQIFSDVTHTADFASEVPRTVTDYNDAEQTIEVVTATNVDELSSFTATVATPTNTDLKFILEVDAQDRYWTGTAWANSDGTIAQASDAAQINTNALTLIATTSAIKVKAVLDNSSEADRPTISSVTFGDIGLVDGSTYKVYVTFLIWDEDSKNYIESELGAASAATAADLSDQDLSLTAIDTYDGAAVEPTTVWRRIYVSKLASGETAYGEPFYSQDIEDNTTTTATITVDPTSTITPPSDCEVDSLSNDHLYIGSRALTQEGDNRLRRYDPDNSSSTPDFYAVNGTKSIRILPKLAATSTDAQRTLEYYVYRRPHEIFYDVDREIDLPIFAKKALKQGIIARAYFHKDRDTMVSQENLYEQYKREFKKKMRRQIGKPSTIRDVIGDAEGFEVI